MAEGARFFLTDEMAEAAAVIQNFSVEQAREVYKNALKKSRFFLTGEGSSRIFPAKHAIDLALRKNLKQEFHTEGSYQAMELPLIDWQVFAASNSGKTKELILLLRKLQQEQQTALGITNGRQTPVHQLTASTYLLNCGAEQAIAATKTVVEQALFSHALVSDLAGEDLAAQLPAAAAAAGQVLNGKVEARITDILAGGQRVYWVGRNDGVAEELMLKTMEITRKSAMYLEGTLAFHGIEEVMSDQDVMILVDPFAWEEENFEQVLRQKIGIKIIAISDHQTKFPTIMIPAIEEFKGYLQLMAGWKLLASAGIQLGINIDRPARARKVGNELKEEK